MLFPNSTSALLTTWLRGMCCIATHLVASAKLQYINRKKENEMYVIRVIDKHNIGSKLLKTNPIIGINNGLANNNQLPRSRCHHSYYGIRRLHKFLRFYLLTNNCPVVFSRILGILWTKKTHLVWKIGVWCTRFHPKLRNLRAIHVLNLTMSNRNLGKTKVSKFFIPQKRANYAALQ